MSHQGNYSTDISEKSGRKKKPAFVFAKEWNGDIRYAKKLLYMPKFIGHFFKWMF